jgi:glucose uptake protein GlcU
MSEVVGFLAVIVATLFFGSNFVPVKKYDTGDGVFFQWVLCAAIWVTGVVVNLIRADGTGWDSHVTFYPFAMLGGVVWCTGNITVVPIVKCIGLGLGMCLWASSNLLIGWASGTFGLFGLKSQSVPVPALNYVGVVLAIAGTICFTFVKTETSSEKPDDRGFHRLPEDESINKHTDHNGDKSFIDDLSTFQKRLLGIVLSLVAGCFYGANFDPPQLVIDRATGASSDGLDYVFSHFTGIFFTSTVYFGIYCALKKNAPVLYPGAVLPGLLSGVMWAIAQIAFFVANDQLKMTISFPLISTGPALVASLWGVLVFKEIKGVRNLSVLGLSFVLIIVSAVLITLSKVL